MIIHKGVRAVIWIIIGHEMWDQTLPKKPHTLSLRGQAETWRNGEMVASQMKKLFLKEFDDPVHLIFHCQLDK